MTISAPHRASRKRDAMSQPTDLRERLTLHDLPIPLGVRGLGP